jgi:hypothetical protein
MGRCAAVVVCTPPYPRAPVTAEQLVVSAVGVLTPVVAGGLWSWARGLSAKIDQKFDLLAEQSTETAKSVAVIHTTLVGPTGENGIASEVRGLRKRVHSLGDDLHTVKAAQEVFRVRLDNYEDRQS